MKISNLKFLLFLFFLFSSFLSFSQEDPKKEIIEGNKYYIHIVEPGHTLYAISKKYLIDVNAIIEENPEAKDGLKVGQALKIPVIKENKKLHKVNSPEIDGNYILHNVEQGQTLYSISRQYNLEMADIVNENPGVQNSMRIGHTIKIPVNKIKNIKAENIAPAKDDGLVRHMVVKGETLYSLSKQYGVNIDSISIINNELPDGLKVGETIIIPRKRMEGDAGFETVNKSKIDSIYQYIKDKLKGIDVFDTLKGYKNSYNVALMLPFFLDEDAIGEQNRNVNGKDEIFPQSAIALEFYEGFMLALDSLKNQGMSARLFVYDTGSDTNNIKSLLLKPELKEMDIIIGPLYSSAFNMVSKFALINKIHIVAPFVQLNNIVLDNPYVSKPASSQTTQFEKMALYISEKYPKDNIVVVHNSSLKDKNLVSTFLQSAKIAFDSTDQIKEVTYNVSGFSGLQKALSPSKNNIIIVPSNDQAFITDMVTKLNFLNDNYNVILFGIDSWLNFDNMDINYLHKLQTHITTSNHIDFLKDDVINFVKLYRSTYYTDPSIYAFQGFDVAYYYLSSLYKHGTYFDSELNSCKYQGLQISYDFNRLNSVSGFENRSVSIVKYEDFKLIKVN